MKMITFFLIGLTVHVVFFLSIFDIYFTSPLVHGMTPQSTPLAPPASRLVLVVADGLRADSLFTLLPNNSSRTPFLRPKLIFTIRTIIEETGTWGVSHTRVPTESRPGHVALIAGFYEDVSAVAKGWKENPVEFDSVFNESRSTWCWGSPDILPMFAKGSQHVPTQGATGDHVYTHTYPAEEEDFASKDASRLDTWVFTQVKSFFQAAKTNSTLKASLLEDKNIFFLHLLGIDTNGHAHRPMSQEYLDNIALVDTGVDEVVSLIEDFFGHDGRTAYVFTSDHGMTNWGSHGAGHPSETLTPLVVWGAGVNKAQRVTESQPYEDGYLKDWNLEHIRRADVNQADIAPLMASLLGLPIPVNSVGVMPLLYLNNSDQFKAESMYTNAIQVLEQFKMKMIQKKETTLPFLFTPFQLLTESKQAEFTHRARILIQLEKYNDAISLCQSLISLSLEGLVYYHTYDRFFLGCSVVLGFIGWTSYVILVILRTHASLIRYPNLAKQNPNQNLARFCVAVAVVITLFLLIQRSPITYYIYCLLPVPVWYTALKESGALSDLIRSAPSLPLWKCLGYFVLVAFGIELLVVSFFHRSMLTVGLAFLSLWPLLSGLFGKAKLRSVSWFLGCLCLAVFPLMPVVGREPNLHLYLCRPAYSLHFGLLPLVIMAEDTAAHKRQMAIFQSDDPCGRVFVCTIAHTFQPATETRPALSKSDHQLEHISIFYICSSFELNASFSPTPQHIFVSHIHLLASQYWLYSFRKSAESEALFPPVLSWLMFVWINIEQEALLAQGDSRRQELSTIDFSANIDITKIRQLKLDDIRRSYFFVFFIITAFFGTGNIASINSFDPASVYCFLTVFNPFIMGGLMMWKVIIPFIIVMCTFETIQVATQLSSRSLFLIVLVISDVMALHFFFLVQDYGSWLDIGTSISHYVIVMSMTIFLMLLSVVTHVLTSKRLILWNRSKMHFP
ncbi:hypothetical protein CCH79_00004293 [Gambusia affinis]|uniref:GPI ethanolamine phosphate transferase 1 n=1 Tax=Gambusia affinis TaxID=33528 RepID=A0A315V3V5_GAMAF|nr:hypothetical protein CCH79_00004293 [Gambusia affinis]